MNKLRLKILLQENNPASYVFKIINPIFTHIHEFYLYNIKIEFRKAKLINTNLLTQ